MKAFTKLLPLLVLVSLMKGCSNQKPVLEHARVVLHTGDNPEYKTKIVRFTDQDKTLIILCNNAHAKFATVADALGALLRE